MKVTDNYFATNKENFFQPLIPRLGAPTCDGLSNKKLHNFTTLINNPPIPFHLISRLHTQFFTSQLVFAWFYLSTPYFLRFLLFSIFPSSIALLHVLFHPSPILSDVLINSLWKHAQFQAGNLKAKRSGTAHFLSSR